MSSNQVGSDFLNRFVENGENSSIDLFDQANNIMADKCRSRILRMALCMGLFSLGAFGNVRALIQILSHRSTNNDNQAFTPKSKKLALKMSLLVADCFVIFVFLPIKMCQIYFDYWIGGDFTCRLLTFISPIGFFAMSFTVLIIAYDRMLYARSAIQHYSWQKNINKITAGIWGLACLISFPRMVINSYNEPQRSCNPNAMLGEPNSRLHHSVITSYTAITVVFIFFIPLIGMIIAYTVICRIVARSQGSAREDKNQDKHAREPMVRYKAGTGIQYQHDNQHNQRPLSKRTYKVSTKARRLTTLVILPYILSWSPYQILAIWTLVTGDGAVTETFTSVITETALVLAVSNAVLNPFLYAKVDR